MANNDKYMANRVYYRWREPFQDAWHETACEVVSHTDKTAVIRLSGFGKNQTPPGTVMRVRLKSLRGFALPEPERDEPDWHRYTYFD